MIQMKTRSAEIARRAIETVSKRGGVDPKIIPLFFQEAERLAPNDAILDITETAEEDTFWELSVINSVTRSM